MKYLTEIIKEQRKLLGISQEQIAQVLRISQQAYSILENKPEKLSLNRILEISRILNFSLPKALEIEEKETLPYSARYRNFEKVQAKKQSLVNEMSEQQL